MQVAFDACPPGSGGWCAAVVDMAGSKGSLQSGVEPPNSVSDDHSYRGDGVLHLVRNERKEKGTPTMTACGRTCVRMLHPHPQGGTAMSVMRQRTELGFHDGLV
jgi:hypothetical protein